MIKIQELSDETINQIAAGEVVENPAAVVKELMENAIDAQATRMVVEIVGGGFSLIRVSDNGIGMSPHDAKLCFQRHTTSKLRHISDLDTLASMGFRGEALASIASVAKVDLQTNDLSRGTHLVLHGGKLAFEGVCARDRGTTVSVESLFYNTPARKSFQKSPATATSEILKVVTKAALAFPECQITLRSNGEILLDSRSLPFVDKVKEVLGFTEGTEVHFTEGDYQIKGFVGSPGETRVNRSGQYLFINKRPITSYLVSSAVLEGYGTRIDAKRFPVFALHFDLPASLVDVNVHPQKTQVRFKEEKEIASLFRRAILRAWQKIEAPEFLMPPREGISFENFCLREKPMPRETPMYKAPVLEAKAEINVLHLLGSYALYETEGSLFLIDLPAARARLIFDQVVQKKAFSLEQFLFPEVLEFPPAESSLIRESLDKLLEVGILLRPFGKGSFVLEGLAPFLSSATVKDFLFEILHLDAMMREKWAEVASRYARKEKSLFSKVSAAALIEAFYRAGTVPYCPKGRSVLVPYTQETLEKLFA